MSITKTETKRVADQAAQSADDLISSTKHAANKALDNLSDTVKDVRDEAVPFINRAADRAHALTERGLDMARYQSRRISQQAHRVSDGTVSYIKEKPVKAALIAMATGAALMALTTLLSRSRRD